MQETQEIWVRSLDQEDRLEKEVATHSSILAWKIPWMEGHSGLQSMGSQESDTAEHAGMSSTIWWLNRRMWNLTYGGPTVKLCLGFWLFRGMIPPTPSLLKDQLYSRPWDFMRPRGIFRSLRSKMLAGRDLTMAWRVDLPQTVGAWLGLSVGWTVICASWLRASWSFVDITLMAM